MDDQERALRQLIAKNEQTIEELGKRKGITVAHHLMAQLREINTEKRKELDRLLEAAP